MNVRYSIKNLRERHDMTQEELGKVAGVSAMAVSQWENGRAVPRMGAIQRMSDYFGVPKSEIMGDRYEYALVSLSEPGEDEVLNLYRSLSDEGRNQLLIFARGLVATYPKAIS